MIKELNTLRVHLDSLKEEERKLWASEARYRVFVYNIVAERPDAIRAENFAAGIILSSGYSLNGEAQDILSRGGLISFMQKLFELTELSQKIRDILDK